MIEKNSLLCEYNVNFRIVSLNPNHFVYTVFQFFVLFIAFVFAVWPHSSIDLLEKNSLSPYCITGSVLGTAEPKKK